MQCAHKDAHRFGITLHSVHLRLRPRLSVALMPFFLQLWSLHQTLIATCALGEEHSIAETHSTVLCQEQNHMLTWYIAILL